jgi:RNA polymerase sigma-70 factor (ECF subfamily)
MEDGSKKTLQLLRQWHEGDQDSLNALLERHLQWIRDQVGKRMGPALRSKGETLDYVQDAMVEFLKYGPRFTLSDEDHFRALLLRIVQNTLRNRHDWFTARRRNIAQERPLPSETVLSLDPAKAPVKTPSSLLAHHEQEAWIRMGLEFLEEEHREIIVLRKWDELSFKEIGEHLGVSPNAARMRHRHAVLKLEEMIWKLRSGDIRSVSEENPP